MEFKFAHIILFFLLATSFETLMAQNKSDELQVIKLPKEVKSADECPGKLMWPECIGALAPLMKEFILKENPNVNYIPYVLSGSQTPTSVDCSRVILYVNVVGDVIYMPMVG